LKAKDFAALLDSRPSGDGWIACCPAHEDRSPSLRVVQGDSAVLLHCYAGCSVEEIAQAMGLRMEDLFDGEPLEIWERVVLKELRADKRRRETDEFWESSGYLG